MKILWFSDAHCQPDENPERFSALGDLILARQPDIIIQGGDFGSFNSLSHFDRDKRRKMEGRRLKKDFDAYNTAVELLLDPIQKHNAHQRSVKARQYLPTWEWIEGNHEFWLETYINYNPEHEGYIELEENVDFSQFPGKLHHVPFRESDDDWYTEYAQVYFCHAPRNRTRLVTGEYVAARALQVMDSSVVFGHTHRRVIHSIRRTGGGGVLTALSAGCFFEDTPEYAIGNNNDYWKGVHIITPVGDGDFDMETISLRRIYRGDY